jgi:hypothetical protein
METTPPKATPGYRRSGRSDDGSCILRQTNVESTIRSKWVILDLDADPKMALFVVAIAASVEGYPRGS